MQLAASLSALQPPPAAPADGGAAADAASASDEVLVAAHDLRLDQPPGAALLGVLSACSASAAAELPHAPRRSARFAIERATTPINMALLATPARALAITLEATTADGWPVEPLMGEASAERLSDAVLLAVSHGTPALLELELTDHTGAGRGALVVAVAPPSMLNATPQSLAAAALERGLDASAGGASDDGAWGGLGPPPASAWGAVPAAAASPPLYSGGASTAAGGAGAKTGESGSPSRDLPPRRSPARAAGARARPGPAGPAPAAAAAVAAELSALSLSFEERLRCTA